MRVIVAFEFEGVDPWSEEAEKKIAEIRESCETMQVGFDATGCSITDVEYD